MSYLKYISYCKSPLGDMTISSDGSSLTGLWFVGQKYYPREINNALSDSTFCLFSDVISWLDLYFEGKNPSVNFKLNPKGTLFQKEIWKLLLEIPYGETLTYKNIAEEYAKRKNIRSMSAQAVGNAVSRNPISIIIPCHRVIGADGSLTGYAGGTDKKAFLLDMERNV